MYHSFLNQAAVKIQLGFGPFCGIIRQDSADETGTHRAGREGNRIGKDLEQGIKLATALYVGALPTRLLSPT